MCARHSVRMKEAFRSRSPPPPPYPSPYHSPYCTLYAPPSLPFSLPLTLLYSPSQVNADLGAGRNGEKGGRGGEGGGGGGVAPPRTPCLSGTHAARLPRNKNEKGVRLHAA